MKILALILARGGSKRLPGKNIKILGDRPLINWSISTAKSIPEICDILVSTDDPKIRDVAIKAGALSPWLRPKSLSHDSSSSVDASIHAIDYYESKFGPVDGLLLLQPTSPFRSLKKIVEGINLFNSNKNVSVLGVSPSHAHPKWTFTINSGVLKTYHKDHGLNLRSQELEPAYVINGSFYIISPSTLRDHKSFFVNRSLPLIMNSRIEALDIDTYEDWKIAESLAANFNQDFF